MKKENSFVDSHRLKVSSVKVEKELNSDNTESIIGHIQEHLEKTTNTEMLYRKSWMRSVIREGKKDMSWKRGSMGNWKRSSMLRMHHPEGCEDDQGEY